MSEPPIPQGWKMTPLGEILTEADIRACAYRDGAGLDLPVLSLTKSQGIVLQSERFNHRVATEDVSDYKVVEREWIVYNPYVLWEGAIHALWKHDVGLVSPVYPVWKVTGADPYYLDLLLKTPPLMETYERVCSGVVKRRRSISKTQFQGFEVLLPPPCEQRAIAAVLRAAQDARDARHNELALERERKAALMEDLFRCGVCGEVCKQTELGPMPESWRVAKLGGFIAEGPQNGLYKHASEYGDGTPIIRINDFNNDGEFVTTALNRVRLSDADGKRYAVRQSDLLINRVNSLTHIGKCALVLELTEPTVFESNMMRFRVDESQLLPDFLRRYLTLDGTRERLRSMAKRAVAQSSINQGNVRALLVPLPDIEEQRDIAEVLTACDQKIASLEAENALYDELFRALLEELMTGRLSAAALIEEEIAH